jgi:chromosome segregation ATPase
MSSKKAPAVATTATGWKKIPSSYKELAAAFRALVKECEAAKQIAADNWKSIGEWKEKERVASMNLASMTGSARGWKDLFDKAEAERDLALSGKAGAEQREAAALEHCRELATSEGELRGQVANLETRLAWAENGRHVLERRFYEFALSKGATLEELRDQFPGYRIDHRGTVA